MTPHFTARELGITDATPPEHVAALRVLATEILEPIRAYVGRPVVVTDGWRPPSAAYGSPTSQHRLGEAADIMVRGDLVALWRWIAFRSGLPFGQCILERRRPGPYTWIHVSLGAPLCARPIERSRQAMISPDGKTYLRATVDTVPPT